MPNKSFFMTYADGLLINKGEAGASLSREVNTEVLNISGGSDQNFSILGGTIKLYGGAHATTPHKIEFLQNDAVVLEKTQSGDWDFKTGNILTSGTIDGRDISADGAVLDGIDPNATDDQTAAEILTAIKTVDGTGSGLDSDLLDGNEATAFALVANDFVNVKEQGATGDGVTDDSAAIRTAIAAGDVIFFPEGTYLVTQDAANAWALQVASGKRIIGAGMYSTTIKLDDAQNVSVFSVPASAAGTSFEHLQIDGNKANQTAGSNSNGIVFLQNTTDALVKHCYIHDCTACGIRITWGADRSVVAYNQVVACGDSTNEDSGILLTSSGNGAGDTGCDHARIHGNVCRGNYNANMSILAKNSAITSNVCYDSTAGDNISVYAWEGVKYNTIANNVCRNAGLHGIHTGGDYITITGNTVVTAGSRCILHAFTKNNTAFTGVSITGNTVSDSTTHAIEITDVTTGAVVSGNVVESSGARGIVLNITGLSVQQDASVTGNVCKSCGQSGIALTDIDGSTVTGNVCNNNSTDGIELLRAENNVISGNTCLTNGAYGIDMLTGGTSTGNLITGNRLKSNVTNPINADSTDATNNVFDRNLTDGSRSVASATNIVVPVWVGSGEYIHITGTTQIDTISSRHDGFVAALAFSTAVTVADSAIRIAGSYTSAAHDVLTLQYTDNGTAAWREVSRSVNG